MIGFLRDVVIKKTANAAEVFPKDFTTLLAIRAYALLVFALGALEFLYFMSVKLMCFFGVCRQHCFIVTMPAPIVFPTALSKEHTASPVMRAPVRKLLFELGFSAQTPYFEWKKGVVTSLQLQSHRNWTPNPRHPHHPHHRQLPLRLAVGLEAAKTQGFNGI